MSIPKRPRQQMINLMYLVLTALLALNVSSEILNAFSLVNKGLDETNASIEKKTDWTYNILQSTRDEATPLQLEYINRSLEARDIATALNVELDRVIELIEEESGGYTDEGKLKKEDNLDIASRVMISNGEGLVNFRKGSTKPRTSSWLWSMKKIALILRSLWLRSIRLMTNTIGTGRPRILK